MEALIYKNYVGLYKYIDYFKNNYIISNKFFREYGKLF